MGTTYSIDHLGNKVQFGLSGNSISEQFGVEQIHGELTPAQAREIAFNLLNHADYAEGIISRGKINVKGGTISRNNDLVGGDKVVEE